MVVVFLIYLQIKVKNELREFYSYLVFLLYTNICRLRFDLQNAWIANQYYYLAIDWARVLLHPSPAAMFSSSHSSFLTILPEKRSAVFRFPKRQSWFIHEKLKLSLWKSKEGTLFFWKKSEKRTMWWWKYKK